MAGEPGELLQGTLEMMVLKTFPSNRCMAGGSRSASSRCRTTCFS